LFFLRFEGAALGAAILPAHCSWKAASVSMSDKNIIPIDPVVLLRMGVTRDLGVCFGDDDCCWRGSGDDTIGVTLWVAKPATEGFRGEAGEAGGAIAFFASVCAMGAPKTNWAAPASSGDMNNWDKLSSGSRLPHELVSISSGPGEDRGDEGAAVEAVPSLSLRFEVLLLRPLSFLLFVTPANDLLTTLDRNDFVDFTDLLSSDSSSSMWMESSSLCFCLLNKLLMLLFWLLLCAFE